MRRYLLLLISVALVCSCTSALYTPASPDPVEQQALVSGRKLYVEKCSGCHRLYPPSRYDAPQWQHWVNKMQERAKASDAEKALVLRYLTGSPATSGARGS